MRSSGVSSGQRRVRRRGARRPVKKTSSVSTAVKKYVQRVVPAVELKENWYHDNEVQLNTLTQGAMQAHPQVTNGTTHVARIGNEIALKAFEVKGILNNNSTSESFARLLILGHSGDLDPTFSTFPIFRNAANGTTSNISGVNGLDTMYYPINDVDTHIYYDRVIRLAGSATGNAAGNTTMFKKKITFPGKGKKVTYDGAGIGLGNQTWFISVYWIVADANDDTTGGTVVELSQLTRYWFTDC